MKVHTAVYRATGGRVGHRLPRNPPVLLLDHVGARSGNPKHPAWFHNLRANPEERARLWPKVVAAYRGYEGYQRRTKREIPIVLLEPSTTAS